MTPENKILLLMFSVLLEVMILTIFDVSNIVAMAGIVYAATFPVWGFYYYDVWKEEEFYLKSETPKQSRHPVPKPQRRKIEG